MENTHDFRLQATDSVSYIGSAELEGMYKLSPFVWREGDHFELLLRVVNYSDNPSEKVARIHRGISLDGLRFALGRIRSSRRGPKNFMTAAVVKIHPSRSSMARTTCTTRAGMNASSAVNFS